MKTAAKASRNGTGVQEADVAIIFLNIAENPFTFGNLKERAKHRGKGEEGQRGREKQSNSKVLITFPRYPVSRFPSLRSVGQKSSRDSWFWLRANQPVNKFSVLED